ncbi:MAG: hypothetical protein H6797_02700 [Candidatus Nomurabacteria bacterium]|nr:MAG: hypothetical protein H6797_02700 [Candidatus Nomurabacteria bacterium]
MENKPEESLDNTPENTGIEPVTNQRDAQTAETESSSSVEDSVSIESEQSETTEPIRPIQLPIVEPKNKKTPWLWALLVLALFVIADGVYYYAGILNKPKDEAKVQTVATSSPSPTPSISAENIVSSVKDLKLQGKIAPIVKSDKTSGETDGGVNVYGAYPYQIDGKKFANDPLNVYGTGTLGLASVAKSDFSALQSYLEDEGFSQMKDEPYAALITEPDQELVYLSTKVLCQIKYTHSTKSTADDADMASISCADLSSYEAASTVLQPFYDAYVASVKPAGGPATYLKAPLATNDGMDGYMNASLGISTVGSPFDSSEGFFYQEAGRDWTYVRSSQDGLYCDWLTTDTMKKAFNGQPCYDSTTKKQSIVSA